MWILLSDRLLAALVTDHEVFTILSIAKGWLYVLLTAWLLYALIKRDVSALRRSERSLEVSEKRFRLAVDSFPYMLVIYDPSLRFSYANTQAIRQIGRSESEIVGHRDEDILPPDEVRKYLPTLLRALETKSDQTIETSLDLPSGTMIAVFSFIPVLDDDGRVYQILGLVRDVTERRMAERHERELEARQQEFYRRTILAATEDKLVIADRDEICPIAEPPVAAWSIESGADLAHIRQEIERIALGIGMIPNRVYDLVLAAGEATTNAYKHARGGRASIHRMRDGLMVVVSDQGEGMDALQLPEVALKRGYSTAKSLGMGYKAILSVADKVYLSTGPNGTTVGILMGIRPPESVFEKIGLPDTWAQAGTPS